MFLLNILLSAFLVLPSAEGDTIRTEHLNEVVVTSQSARQRIQNVQTGAEVLQLEDLTATPQLFGEADYGNILVSEAANDGESGRELAEAAVDDD